MSVHKASVKCRLSYYFLAVLMILFLGLIVFFVQLSRHINEISEYEGKLQANILINDAVRQQLAEENVSENELITVDRNDSGEIVSVQTNSTAINEISNNISTSVNDSLKNFEDEEIKVPIGTLSGITFLTGRGFDVGIRLHQMGAVKTQMKSEFVSAGINQTKYRLYIDVTVEMSAILPNCSTDIIVTNTYLVCETVLMGNVPNVYVEK